MNKIYKRIISLLITFLFLPIFYLCNNHSIYIINAEQSSSSHYPPISNAIITSDYGPRTNGSYDFHFGIDLANGSRSLIKAIEGGPINIVEGSNVATIAIGKWEYLHITKDAGYPADGYHLVKRNTETLKYYHPEKKRYYEVTKECIVFWSNSTEVEKVLCNAFSYPLVYQYGSFLNRKEITAKSSVKTGEGFALVGDTGSPGSIHLHLQIRDGNAIKNPLIVYPHDSPDYRIRIDEPTNSEEISHDKPESEKKSNLTLIQQREKI